MCIHEQLVIYLNDMQIYAQNIINMEIYALPIINMQKHAKTITTSLTLTTNNKRTIKLCTYAHFWEREQLHDKSSTAQKYQTIEVSFIKTI